MKCIKNLTNYCVEKGIIAEDKSEWFQYGIERRLISILIGCPFFVLALILTDFSVSASFFLSFYYLRSRTNGFHAKSVHACLIISLLCEFFFLTIFYYSLFFYTILSLSSHTHHVFYLLNHLSHFE